MIGNGTEDTFALMPVNDVVPPTGFSRTDGTFQGVAAPLFTRAGSLPLVYGALSNDASPLFYLYNASGSSLYSFFDDILLQNDGKTFAVSPIAVPAPSPDFRYRSISINNQPMSAYESTLGGIRTTLVYAAENGQSNKQLYVYNVNNPNTPLSLYNPSAKVSVSPSPTPATAMISVTTTANMSEEGKGGLDFMTILLIIIFLALLGGLAYVAYMNQDRIKALFIQKRSGHDAYFDKIDDHVDEDYYDDDYQDDDFQDRDYQNSTYSNDPHLNDTYRNNDPYRNDTYRNNDSYRNDDYRSNHDYDDSSHYSGPPIRRV